MLNDTFSSILSTLYTKHVTKSCAAYSLGTSAPSWCPARYQNVTIIVVLVLCPNLVRVPFEDLLNLEHVEHCLADVGVLCSLNFSSHLRNDVE